jgi:hypothetical protein
LEKDPAYEPARKNLERATSFALDGSIRMEDQKTKSQEDKAE